MANRAHRANWMNHRKQVKANIQKRFARKKAIETYVKK